MYFNTHCTATELQNIWDTNKQCTEILYSITKTDYHYHHNRNPNQTHIHTKTVKTSNTLNKI